MGPTFCTIVALQGRWTIAVFERAHSGWVCINSQRTVLREDGGKSKRQSAELPFHFPIFGKSDKKDSQ